MEVFERPILVVICFQFSFMSLLPLCLQCYSFFSNYVTQTLKTYIFEQDEKLEGINVSYPRKYILNYGYYWFWFLEKGP